MVAAALGAGARLVVLDEPLAHLDPRGAMELVRILRDLADGGVAVLLVEHRLEPVLPFCDRIAVMDCGRIVDVRSAAEPDLPLLRRLGLRLPGLVDVEDRLRRRGLDPPSPRAAPAHPPPTSAPVISAQEVGYTYPGADSPALLGVSVELRPGERIAVLGGNGAGKSTLLAALVGGLRVKGVSRRGRSVRVPQDPDLALFCPTVREELEYGPREARGGRAEVARAADAAAAALSVQALEPRAPQALSRGQRLRVAVAAALACDPDVLVLDEPTSGQDHDQVERMMSALTADSDRALLFATHDVDLALRHATRIWILEGGRVVLDAPPDRAVAHLALGSTLRLPALAAWCLERGLPSMTAAQIEALAAEGAS
jgi:energy-coupling factor transport system ATP-binding protein